MGRAFFSVALLLLGPLGGCFVSRGPIDLRDASTRVVRFGVDASRGGICPGQPVALDIELTAEVGSQTLRLTRTRHDLNDAIFDMRQIRLASAQGRFDEDGRFFPDPDPSVSAQSGFVFYVDVPRGPTFSVRYPPVYECTTPFGREGQIGGDGLKGADAIFEDETGPGLGGAEAPSARGFLGGEGGRGGDGPDLTIYVTWVRTPDYTKLLAARAEGDVQGVTLRAPGTPLNVMARGGVGGAGGAGGQGATGLEHVLRYTKRHHAAVSERAPGGSGGAGGTGGGGGAGGTVRVVLDERFELESWVEVDVRGGAGGAGGRGGSGGAGNNGGWTAAAHAGIPGQPGRDGPAGPRGNVTIERGDVREHFQNLGAIVALETL